MNYVSMPCAEGVSSRRVVLLDFGIGRGMVPVVYSLGRNEARRYNVMEREGKLHAASKDGPGCWKMKKVPINISTNACWLCFVHNVVLSCQRGLEQPSASTSNGKYITDRHITHLNSYRGCPSQHARRGVLRRARDHDDESTSDKYRCHEHDKFVSVGYE